MASSNNSYYNKKSYPKFTELGVNYIQQQVQKNPYPTTEEVEKISQLFGCSFQAIKVRAYLRNYCRGTLKYESYIVLSEQMMLMSF